MHMPGRSERSNENSLHVLPTHTNKSPDPVVTTGHEAPNVQVLRNHNGRQGHVDTYYSKELGQTMQTYCWVVQL